MVITTVTIITTATSPGLRRFRGVAQGLQQC